MRHLLISIYFQQYNDTKDAVNKRVQRGYWVDGIHIFKCERFAEEYIDLEEEDKWFGREKPKSKKYHAVSRLKK